MGGGCEVFCLLIICNLLRVCIRSAPAFLTAISRLCRPCRSPQSLHSDFEQQVTEKTELHLCYLCLLLLSLSLSFARLPAQASGRRICVALFPSQSRAPIRARCSTWK